MPQLEQAEEDPLASADITPSPAVQGLRCPATAGGGSSIPRADRTIFGVSERQEEEEVKSEDAAGNY